MTARRDPDEPRFAEDDPRRCWTGSAVRAIVGLHADGKSPVEIGRKLDFPVREVVEVIRKFCEAHDHLFLTTMVAHSEAVVPR